MNLTEPSLYLSIVVPMLDEEDNIIPLLLEIQKELAENKIDKFEIIVVDDGSTDSSASRVREHSQKHSSIRLIRLRRSFGQTAAMAAGIDYSHGKAIVTIDADGQNDPKDIHKLLEKHKEGFDCVSGRRLKRKDKFITRKLPSLLANWIIQRVTKLEIHDFGCTLKVYDGDLLRSIPLYGDMHRLLPFYISLAGGKVSEIGVNHRPRKFGKSKYGIARTFRVINDLLVAKVQGSFFTRPMHLFGNLGLFLMTLSGVAGISAVYMKFMGERDFIESPLLLMSGVLLLTGLQMLFTGFLAEIILRRFSYTTRDQRYTTINNIEGSKYDLS
jgi:glycosyltransferase involved in cell wall biosynthesis